MATVLLVDDERIFKALEGTCLRRERCRLLKSSHARIPETSLAQRPDLIVLFVADDESLEAVCLLLADGSIASIPVLVLHPARTTPPVVAAERTGEVRRVSCGPDQDARVDAAIESLLPVLDRRGDRVTVSVPVRCRVSGRTVTLRTKNVSPSGLFLRSERPLALTGRFEVSFALPDTAGGTAPIAGTCEVVRQVGAKDDRDLIPGLGVRFVEMGRAERAALKSFVSARGSRVAARAAGAAR